MMLVGAEHWIEIITGSTSSTSDASFDRNLLLIRKVAETIVLITIQITKKISS